MTSKVEGFILNVARRCGTVSRHLRGLSRADRDDVLATALLSAWEHRETFNAQSETVEDWFGRELRNARRRLVRHDTVSMDELQLELATRDETAAAAQALIAAEQMERHAVDYGVEDLVAQLAAGKTFTEVTSGMKSSDKRYFSQVLGFLVDTIPQQVDRREVGRTRPKQEAEWRHPVPARIDREVLRDLQPHFPVEDGKECPPCCRCKWFDGFKDLPPRKALADPDVERAIRETEARKLEIATNGVR